MRFRFGAIVGFAAGYVFGARAGRERFDEIRRRAEKVAEAEPVQQLKAQAERVIEQVKEQAGMIERRTSLEDGLDARADAYPASGGLRTGV